METSALCGAGPPAGPPAPPGRHKPRPGRDRPQPGPRGRTMHVNPHPGRRLTVHETLTLASKEAHDLAGQVRNDLLPAFAELHSRSRLVRSKSHFPTLRTLRNDLEHLEEVTGQTMQRLEG